MTWYYKDTTYYADKTENCMQRYLIHFNSTLGKKQNMIYTSVQSGENPFEIEIVQCLTWLCVFL